MSTRLTTFLLLSLAVPAPPFGQDSLSVARRLTRIETQLAAIIETLRVDLDTTASAVPSNLPEGFTDSEHLRFGLPATGDPDDILLNKDFFVVLHDSGKKVAVWVAYDLTRGKPRRRSGVHELSRDDSGFLDH